MYINERGKIIPPEKIIPSRVAFPKLVRKKEEEERAKRNKVGVGGDGASDVSVAGSNGVGDATGVSNDSEVGRECIDNGVSDGVIAGADNDPVIDSVNGPDGNVAGDDTDAHVDAGDVTGHGDVGNSKVGGDDGMANG